MGDYDDEFGPNKLPVCKDCHARLDEGEVCWCQNDPSHFEEKLYHDMSKLCANLEESGAEIVLGTGDEELFYAYVIKFTHIPTGLSYTRRLDELTKFAPDWRIAEEYAKEEAIKDIEGRAIMLGLYDIFKISRDLIKKEYDVVHMPTC